jgi:hypothetical protein
MKARKILEKTQMEIKTDLPRLQDESKPHSIIPYFPQMFECFPCLDPSTTFSIMIEMLIELV